MEKIVFAPSCTMRNKRADQIPILHDLINRIYGREIPTFDKCCKSGAPIEDGTTIITVCFGCRRNMGERYPNIKAVSIWDIIDEHPDVPKFEGYEEMRAELIDFFTKKD